MKKLMIAAVALGLGVTVQAQNEKVTSALEYLRHKELDKAKERIDAAVVHEKTSTSAKAWDAKGKIYMELAKTTNEKYVGLAATPTKDAAEAFRKVIEFDTKGKYSKKAPTFITNMKVSAFNAAIAFLKQETPDHKSAYTSYKKALVVDPNNEYVDYAGNVGILDNYKITSMAASAAKQGGMKAEAITEYNALMAASNPDANRRFGAFYDLAILHNEADETDLALKALEDCYVAFPDSHDVKNQIYKMYVKAEKTDEFLTKLNAQETKTANDWYLAGMCEYNAAAKLSEAEAQQAKITAAFDAWKTCKEMDAKHPKVNGEIGDLEMALGVGAKQVADDNWKNASLSAAKDKEATEFFNKAIASYEEQLKHNTKDIMTLDKIKTCYSKLKNFEKVNEYKAKIANIQAGN